MKTKAKQIMKNFCLEGCISEKHAEDIEAILLGALLEQREEIKEMVEGVKAVEVKSNGRFNACNEILENLTNSRGKKGDYKGIR